MSIRFSVAPGVKAPAGALALTLASIRQAAPPAGRVKAELLDRLTGAYTAFQIARLSQTYFDLLDSAILAKLDGLFIRGLKEADSLLNWVPGKPNAVNNGCAFSAGAGGGFQGNGSSAWVDMAFTPTKYTQNNAGVLAYVQGVGTLGASYHVIGGGSPTAANARLTFTATQAVVGLNAATSTAQDYNGGRTGLWTVHRMSFQALRRNGDLIASAEVAATAIPIGLTLFRESNTFSAQKVSAMGYGGNLVEAEARRLAEILTAHHATI